MRLLVITREQEHERLSSVWDRLSKDHSVQIFFTGQIKHPFWFNLAYAGEEYHFYKKLKGQGSYWKNRIYDFPFAFPKWSRYSFLCHLKKFYKPGQEIIDRLKELNPDAVIATNLVYPPYYADYDYALATKLLGIPLIGIVPTWDALSTKTKVQVQPDYMFCWNYQHQDELGLFHGIENPIMVGAYTFEHFLNQKTKSRGQFCKDMGFDHKKDILTYLCSSPNIDPQEEIFLTKWLNEHKGEQIIIVPHPNKPMKLESKTPRIVMLRPDFQTKVNIYSHSKCYGLNTSALLEAGIIGEIHFLGDKTKSLHYKWLNEALNDKTPLIKWLGFQNKLPSELIAEKINAIIN